MRSRRGEDITKISGMAIGGVAIEIYEMTITKSKRSILLRVVL
jgi:hypothetical protein